MPEKSIQALKQLVSERDMHVCDRAKYKGQLTDQKDFMDSHLYQKKTKRLSQLIHSQVRTFYKPLIEPVIEIFGSNVKLVGFN